MVSYSDYARKLDGLDLCGLGQKPHHIDSHRFHGFPQIFLSMWSDEGHADFADDADLDLSGLGISQISGDFADVLQNFCFFLGGFEKNLRHLRNLRD